MDQPYLVDETFNISDVIDVIQSTDPDYAESMPAYATSMDTSVAGSMDVNVKKKAYVQIIEQPASKALRFRYECEGRSAGSIPGANSTPERKSYPKIQICGYKGRAVVVVSCVTKDQPYRPHPHNLVGKEGCKKGVCTMEINSDDMTCEFANLGIQCVKKKDIEDALKVREEIRVDPYQTGFAHKSQPTGIDLNSLRLCFQVFLEGADKGKFNVSLKPVVSDPIFDKKAMCDLIIIRLSDCSSPASGDKEMILLCDKVAKDDVKVRFYEEQDGQIVWEGYGDFQPSDVHKQVAIAFRTPKYKNIDIEQPVKVNIQLIRPSGGESEPKPFEYHPLHSDPDVLKRKRQKLANSNLDRINNYLHKNTTSMKRPVASAVHHMRQFPIASPEQQMAVKTEQHMRHFTMQTAEQQMPGLSIKTEQHMRHLAMTSPDHHMTGFVVKTEPSEIPSQYMHQTLSPFPAQSPSPLMDHMQYRVPSPMTVSSMSQQQQQSHLQQLSPYPPPYPLSPVMNPVQFNAPAGPIDPYGTASAILDLDNQPPNLELDSSDLGGGLPMSDTNLSFLDSHLSENLSSNLNLLDQAAADISAAAAATAASTTKGMNDSFTRLTASTIRELQELNVLSQPSQPS